MKSSIHIFEIVNHLIYPLLLVVLSSCASRYGQYTRRSNKLVPKQEQRLTQKRIVGFKQQPILDDITGVYADEYSTNLRQITLDVATIKREPLCTTSPVEGSVVKIETGPVAVKQFNAFAQNEGQSTSSNSTRILWVFLLFLLVIILVVELLLPGYGVIGLLLLLVIALLGFLMYKTGMLG